MSEFIIDPKEYGFPPTINGKKTRILKEDEKIQKGDWRLMQQLATGGKFMFREVGLFDLTPIFPNGRIFIRRIDE